jgi:hypothetical protein
MIGGQKSAAGTQRAVIEQHCAADPAEGVLRLQIRASSGSLGSPGGRVMPRALA